MEANPILMAKITVSVVIGGFIVLIMALYNLLVLKPKLLGAKLQRQGIRGPSPSFFFGNIPEMKRIQLQVYSTPRSMITLMLLLMTGLPLSSHIWSSGEINMVPHLSFPFFFFFFLSNYQSRLKYSLGS